jgi:hypothetical protein
VVAIDPYTIGQVVVMALLTCYFAAMLILGIMMKWVLRESVDAKFGVMLAEGVVAVVLVMLLDVRVGTVMFVNGVLLSMNWVVFANVGREVVAQW